MAEIELTRPTGYRIDHGRKYQVFIDRKRAGNIKLGETKIFTLPPGRHELQLKIDWGASEKLQVDLGDRDRAKFVCAPRVKQNDVTIMVGYWLAYWMTFGCRRYIDLRPGDEMVAADEGRGLQTLDGLRLFGIALVLGVAFWVLTGQSIVALGVIVATIAVVLSGLVGRRIGGIASRTGQRRDAD